MEEFNFFIEDMELVDIPRWEENLHGIGQA